MDFRLTEEQELLRRTVREFADTEIRPHVREWDREQHFPAELIPALASLGLMGIQFPEEYGGAAMSAIDYCICIEELARVDPAVALSVAAHNGLCASHIFMSGTEPQKRDYLVPLRDGREDWRVGSDRVDLRQRRRRHAHDGRPAGRIAGSSTAPRRSRPTVASATSWWRWR